MPAPEYHYFEQHTTMRTTAAADTHVQSQWIYTFVRSNKKAATISHQINWQTCIECVCHIDQIHKTKTKNFILPCYHLSSSSVQRTHIHRNTQLFSLSLLRLCAFVRVFFLVKSWKQNKKFIRPFIIILLILFVSELFPYTIRTDICQFISNYCSELPGFKEKVFQYKFGLQLGKF